MAATINDSYTRHHDDNVFTRLNFKAVVVGASEELLGHVADCRVAALNGEVVRAPVALHHEVLLAVVELDVVFLREELEATLDGGYVTTTHQDLEVRHAKANLRVDDVSICIVDP